MGWQGQVNGYGFGTVTVFARSAQGFPASATAKGSSPEAEIPPTGTAATSSPLPIGADPKTNVFCLGAPFWFISGGGVAWNGDSGGGNERIKPGGQRVSTQLQIRGTQYSEKDVAFALQWSGDGPGACQTLSWLETAHPFCPRFNQGRIETPDELLESATLLRTEERSGAWAESCIVRITARHDANNIVLVSLGDVVSSKPHG